MASRTISRVLLVLALIVAAHAFKPVSSKSVIEQLLGAAESLSFVLPDFAEVRIAQATYLAAAFTQVDRTEGPDKMDARSVQAVPAAFEFDSARQPAAPCAKPEAGGSVLAKAGQGRSPVARSLKRKIAIPELPEAMPLSEALAMTIPVGEVELRMLPVMRVSDRQLLRRALFLPASMRPVLPVRKQARIDCDATSIATSEWESELTNTAGPQEEEFFEFDLWDFTSPIETLGIFEESPATTTSPRNCQVEVPAPSPLPLELIPQD